MIKVNYRTHDDRIERFKMRGHANYDVYGRDLVCAAASSIGIGLLNAIDEMAGSSCKIDLQDDAILVEVTDLGNEVLQNILKVGMIQLKTLQEQFPENIRVENTEV